MSASTPQDGDIVIRPEWLNGQSVFVLYQVPGSGQVFVNSRDAAIRKATAFAKRYRVSVWLTDDQLGFALIKNYRTSSSRTA